MVAEGVAHYMERNVPNIQILEMEAEMLQERLEQMPARIVASDAFAKRKKRKAAEEAALRRQSIGNRIAEALTFSPKRQVDNASSPFPPEDD